MPSGAAIRDAIGSDPAVPAAVRWRVRRGCAMMGGMVITPQRLQESLVECAAALAAAGVPFAVAGAFAVAMHGHVRATRDIDFLVRLSDRDAACRAFERLGYVCAHTSDSFAHFERRPLPELPGIVERADLLFSAHEVGHRAIEAAMREPMPWAHGALPVVPLETLVLMKLLAANANPARLQDLVDVRALLARPLRLLNVGAMREVAAWMGPDIERLLEDELSRAARGIGDRSGSYEAGSLGI